MTTISDPTEDALATSFMPPALYTSPAVYELDVRHVIPEGWVLVADLEAVPSPGDYRTERIGVEPVVVVRGRDGRVRAFANVCPHRASLLVEGEGSCGRTLECPYHGWTFGLDGRLLGVPHQTGFAGGVDRSSLGLRPLRTDVWERFVFVNVSGDAPPLGEYLGDVPRLLRNHGIADLRPTVSFVHHVKANWKVLVDNGMCDYHVPVVHSRLMPLIEGPPTWSEDGDSRFVNVLRTPLSASGRAASPVWPKLDGEATEVTYAIGLYPNALVIAFRTGDLHVLTWWPEAVDRTEVRVQAYSHGDRADDDLRYGQEAVERLQLEDIAICELVQQGLQSALYTPGPQHRLERRVQAFQREYLQALARASAVAGAGPEGGTT